MVAMPPEAESPNMALRRSFVGIAGSRYSPPAVIGPQGRTLAV